MRRLLTLALLSIGGLYLAACALLYVNQRRFTFPAPPPRNVEPPSGASLVEIPSAAGKVFALWLPPPENQPVIVAFHGNGEQLADQVGELEQYRRLGLGYFAVEDPGYGPMSAEQPSEAAILQAALSAMAYLHATLHVDPRQVVLLGRSLGTGVAVELARRGEGAGLVLVSPYTSLPEVAHAHFPFFPVRLLMRDRFDSLSKAGEVRVPTLVLHGEADEVIPFSLGQKLVAALPNVQFVPLAGVHHNDVFLGREELYDRIAEHARKAAGPYPTLSASEKRMLEPVRELSLKPDAWLPSLGLHGNETIADVGAGPGFFTVKLARLLPHGKVIATDIDPEALHVAADRGKKESLANIETVVVSAEDPGLAPQSIDLAFVCQVDHYLKDRTAYFRKLKAALKPHGRLALVNYEKYRAPDRAAAADAGFKLLEDRVASPGFFVLIFEST